MTVVSFYFLFYVKLINYVVKLKKKKIVVGLEPSEIAI